MADTVEAIVAEMRGWVVDDEEGNRIAVWADRLQSAHDAEVGALRSIPSVLLAAALAKTLADTESRLREAERDARRYRWLRVSQWDRPGEVPHVLSGTKHQEMDHDLDGDELDAAIDRAMEGEDG